MRVTLHERDVARIDAFFAQMEKGQRTAHRGDGSTSEKMQYAANTRRTTRTIVSGIMQQGVLHQAIASNPVRELERIESPKGYRTALPVV